jgi:nitrite reductase (cytochrome c-552)
MWAGYAFALDFREERGHAYMLDDQTFTARQQRPQPGTCLNCHASTYLAYKKAGDGDIMKGFEKINPLTYAEARPLVEHPVACIDCHTAETLALRITRPAFIEGIRAFKATQGISDFDVNRDATRQEMRSYVCAQCHVEYYFQGTEKRLVEQQLDGALAAQNGDDLAHHVVEARNGAERLQGGAIGGVLPGDGSDLGERDAGAGSRQGGHRKPGARELGS